MPVPNAPQPHPIVAAMTDALRQRIGRDRYDMWFDRGVSWTVRHDADLTTLRLIAPGEFALERLRNHYVREIRAAAASLDPPPMIEMVAAAAGSLAVSGAMDGSSPGTASDRGPDPTAQAPSGQAPLGQAPLGQAPSAQDPRPETRRPGRPRRRVARSAAGLASRGPAKIDSLATASLHAATDRRAGPAPGSRPPTPVPPPGRTSPVQSPAAGVHENSLSGGQSASPSSAGPRGGTMDAFLVGPSSALAHTAASMVCASPRQGTVVYLSGPSGVGKSHLIDAIADTLRRRHRMRGVLSITAEQFTNEFVAVVGKHSVTSFRTRYRGVDALLVDDVHFLAKKKATIREFTHTLSELVAAGRPVVLAGSTTPHETDGITSELAGRMTSGLVCPMAPLDEETRRRLLMRYVELRCPLSIDQNVLDQIVPLLPGDGRVISGVANSIHVLQRMNGRSPDWDTVRKHCSHLLSGAGRVIDLPAIERAVCELFGLPSETLRSGSQSRSVARPRMLAMYLSRQKTSSAYTEIAKHFNVRSHSTAMSAEKNVEKWLREGITMRRGGAAISVGEAVDKVERLLRRSA